MQRALAGAAIERGADVVSRVYVDPAAAEVALDDGTVMPSARMTEPVAVE